MTNANPPGGSDDDSDDEALTWAGDEDRGLTRPRLAGGEPQPDPDPAPVDPRTSEQSPPRGTALTASFAVLYLCLTVGWVLAVQRTSSGTSAFWTELLWQFGEFLAIVAAPLWFGVTVALTRDSRGGVRAGWLALGAGVLVPWPLALGVLATLSSAVAS